jgi:hypothetical protein
MPLWDLSLAEFEQYSPTVEEPADFDEFWAEAIEETRRHDLGLRLRARRQRGLPADILSGRAPPALSRGAGSERACGSRGSGRGPRSPTAP